MSFLNQSYLEQESYLGDGVLGEAPTMPAPDPQMLVRHPDSNLIQIPFTNVVITKQTALIAAALLAVGAWYFFVYKPKN